MEVFFFYLEPLSPLSRGCPIISLCSLWGKSFRSWPIICPRWVYKTCRRCYCNNSPAAQLCKMCCSSLYELPLLSLFQPMAVRLRLRLAFKMQLVSLHTSSVEALDLFPVNRDHNSDYICGLEQFFIAFSSVGTLLSELLDILLSIGITKTVSWLFQMLIFSGLEKQTLSPRIFSF